MVNLPNVLLSGLISEFGPSVLKGVMNEYMKRVNTRELIEWIQADKSLWDNLEEKWKVQVKRYVPRGGNIDWLTYEWLFEITRNCNPSLASLFLNWKQGREWLQRQIEIIKIEIFK